MLKEYFKDGAILFAPEVAGWSEAVDEVTAPLLKAGSITEGYVEAIKKSIASPGGTYIDLGGQVAMAHARPETGVNATSLSVLHVAKPFLLADDENHPITTMFCLAAKDANTHIELMQALATLLTDADKLKALGEATGAEDLRKILL
ncbi:PTS sugar transporter subunit IIA [Bifidobacterium sp. ESL0682]|uniref:PTS sugar transporter subunit IIA n=1 Tax=Bifidobacterium sp. ESL0682 TaxID=2983212 RepID=UPI0023F8C06D|nr:PTS sugar transporter subunit IIA [Bifidobacterium sp. ESL0682]WEV42119.1 PTS sugar transporter subunit IIA [Bifidobacterium sp. ESL0682]